jgi:hypothetical protein
LASSECSLSINIDNVDFTLSVSHKRKGAISTPLTFGGFETAPLYGVCWWSIYFFFLTIKYVMMASAINRMTPPMM